MPALPPNTPPLPVLPSAQRWPLHGVGASRATEAAGLAATARHTLMQRAGLATARLALALAAPGDAVSVLAGPGNNGGDGFVAATWLQRWGRPVQVHWLGDTRRLPDDARHALAGAQAAGVAITSGLPDILPGTGLAIDALLGLGASRAPAGAIAEAIRLLNQAAAPVLAVDLPSGLDAGTGRVLGEAAVRARHTLSLLTLKPGLFTGQGREHAGQVWWHGLELEAPTAAPDAWLWPPPEWPARRHGQHKGSFGDVWVLGGAAGMGGAALLAARAALTAGAGRVYLGRLDGNTAPDPMRPELMPRNAAALLALETVTTATVVCGCGGGDAVRSILPAVLARSGRLVLDADGLNAVATDAALLTALRARADHGQPTILTPHPLEAARLLGCSTADVQADRLAKAQTLADRLQCAVVLKGSGSITAAPGAVPAVNPTGNARLGTAGSGDVLAGWLGGTWSQHGPVAAQVVAADTVWLHGRAAEGGDDRLPLRANDLIDAMAQAMADAAAA